MSVVFYVDVGGSALKLQAITHDGVVSGESYVLPLTARGAMLSFEPSEWSRIVLEAMRRAVAWAVDRGERIDGIVVGSIRQAFVLLDGNEPVSEGVMNLDTRGKSLLDDHLQELEYYEGASRVWTPPFSTLLKLLWLAHNHPPAWARASHLAFVHDWIVLELTGQLVCEPSILSSAQLYSLEDRDQISGFHGGRLVNLPEIGALRNPGDVAGSVIVPEIRRLVTTEIPVIVGGGDTQMATRGVGARIGDAVVTAGSTCPLQYVLASGQQSTAAPRDSIPWLSELATDRWVAETSAGASGHVRAWICRRAGDRALNTPPWSAKRAVPEALRLVSGPLAWNRESLFRVTPGVLGRHTVDGEALLDALRLDQVLNLAGQLKDIEALFPQGATGRILLTGGGASKDLAEGLSAAIGRPVWRDVLGHAPAFGAARLCWADFDPQLNLENVDRSGSAILSETREAHRSLHGAAEGGKIEIGTRFDL